MGDQTFCYLQMFKQSTREISNLTLLLFKVLIQEHSQKKSLLRDTKITARRIPWRPPPRMIIVAFLRQILTNQQDLTGVEQLDNVAKPTLLISRRPPLPETVTVSAQDIFPLLLLEVPALIQCRVLNVWRLKTRKGTGYINLTLRK